MEAEEEESHQYSHSGLAVRVVILPSSALLVLVKVFLLMAVGPHDSLKQI